MKENCFKLTDAKKTKRFKFQASNASVVTSCPSDSVPVGPTPNTKSKGGVNLTSQQYGQLLQSINCVGTTLVYIYRFRVRILFPAFPGYSSWTLLLRLKNM